VNSDTTPITIEIPNDILARIDAKRPPEMSREHIVSLLVGLGISAASRIEFVTLGNAKQVDAQTDQRIESVAMHLRDRLRMYLEKVGTSQMSDQPEVVAAIDEVIGAAMASGWMYSCYLIGRGCALMDLDRAVTMVSEEFDYKVEPI
jgi:hypothetical protein